MTQRPRAQRGLALWLASTSTPVFVLDARRKVLFFNRGCEQLTGWQAGDVIGQVCDYVSEPDPGQLEALTGALCPPQDVTAGAQVLVPAFIVHRQGERTGRQILFVPLESEEGPAERTLGIILPLPQSALAAITTPAQQLHAELASLRSDLRRRYGVSSLVGQSAPFRRMLSRLQLGRTSLVPVHLSGEAGTGKEQLARIIHYDSSLRLKSFVPIDCRALPAREIRNTITRAFEESRHAEGAARLLPGTLYLRDVDRLPRDVQQILVESLVEEGSADGPPLRLISSSTSPLVHAVEADMLSEECYYLLTELTIEVPALREHLEDLPVIAQQLLEDLNRDQESQVEGFSLEVWQQFRKYNWPGNQQELRMVIQEARDRCTRNLISLADLPFRFRTGQEAQRVGPPRTITLRPLAETLEGVEREQIQQALEAAQHNKSRAAELLGLTRPRLYRRMETLGLIDNGRADTESEGEA